MDWLPQCVQGTSGLWSAFEVCFPGRDAYDFIGLLLACAGLVGVSVWGLVKAIGIWSGRRAQAAIDRLLPKRPDWPEISNLSSQRQTHAYVRRHDTDTLIQRLTKANATVLQASVTGLGGIGKTTLALETAREIQQRFEGVWTVSAADIDSLRNGLAALAKELKTEQAESRPHDAALSALDALGKRGTPWLLIYDNADTPQDVNRYFPNETDLPNVTVIYTSRDTSWDAYQTLALDRMTLDEALEMLRQGLVGRQDSDADLARLAEALDFWPLALSAAQGYLSKYRSQSIAEYLDQFDILRKEMTQPASPYYDPDRPETHSISAALKISTDRLGPQARALLSLHCWLDPDDLWEEMLADGVASEIAKPFNGEALLHDLTQVAGQKGWVGIALDELRAQSLVTDLDGRIRMHRLLAQFWRRGLEKADEGLAKLWRKAATQVVNAETPYGYNSPGNTQSFTRLMPQARALLELGAEGGAAARLFTQLSNFALHRGIQPGDITMARRAVEIRAKDAPQSADHATCLNTLSQFHDQAGEYDEALELLEKVRQIRAALPEIGETHPSYAGTLNNIAGVHHETKAYDKAEPLYLQALQISEAELGAEHPDTITWYRNLGAICSEWASSLPEGEAASGLRKREAAYNSRALDLSQQALGPRHTDVALDLNNSALRLWAAGQQAEGCDLMRQAAALRLDLLGPQHPWTLGSLDAYLEFSQDLKADPQTVLQALVTQAAEARAAQRDWGAARLDALCEEYEVAGEEAEALLQALAPKVLARAEAQDKAGEPVELYMWTAQQFTDALHAVTLDPDPGPEFGAKLHAALQILQQQAL